MRAIVLVLAVILASVAALGWATAGFQALTSEQARRQAVDRQPVGLPAAELVLDDGARLSLADLAGEQGKTTLVAFIFTRCNDICIVQGNEFQQLQRQIAQNGLADRLRLLSISFDPTHDTAEVLGRYAGWLGTDPDIWRFATIPDAAQLRAVLEAFGIVVIADEFGGFQHNAAYHVVSPAGELTAIVDLDQPRRALARALAAGAEPGQ